jgi:hypothetical protein
MPRQEPIYLRKSQMKLIAEMVEQLSMDHPWGCDEEGCTHERDFKEILDQVE